MGSLEEAVRAKGEEIFRLMEAEPPAVFDKRRWAGMLMNAAMADPELKVRLFRFVDVLPTLTSTELLIGHIREYFLDPGSPVPPLLRKVLRGLDSPLTAGLTAELVRRNIVGLSRTFIAGATPAEALPRLHKLWLAGSAATVDILGEAALSEKEAQEYLDLYLELTAALAGEMAGWPPHEQGRERLFPRLNISVKASSLFSRIGPVNYEESVSGVKERLRPIFRRVREAGGFVNLDMETYSLKNITLDVFTELLDEKEFRGWEGAGIALQAYLPETFADLGRLAGWAAQGGRRVTVRLVKGAYWEYETVTAQQKGWPVPVYGAKGHTDWNFERCAEYMLANQERIVAALGTHNVRSLASAMTAAERHGVEKEGFEFQMLYGMAEPVKEAVRRLGYAVREYVPVGELLPGMAYLVRRLLENTSNEGFLRRTFVDGVGREALLAAPPPPPPAEAPPPTGEGVGVFVNEPPLDFAVRENREGCRGAIAKVRGELGKRYPAVIDGREIFTDELIVSVNPARPAEVVGTAAAVSPELAEEAAAAARRAQPAWERTPAGERAALLFRAAAIARARRFELLAWQLFETGKSWPEADADVAEAIDYLEYYGREMLRLAEPRRLGKLPGEANHYLYQSRGVALVIAPWNFPLAISTGMVAAALVTGNTVLYKPSSLAVVNGWRLFELFREAGVPAGVLNFLPGRGKIAGELLVGHREVDLIAFTGSREVGLGIVERAARNVAGRRSVKKVIAEMGGKNAIIVDADADLDQAVAAVVQSAFGYQGQKCSACSRVIVLADCYERFMERLVEAVRGLPGGPPENPPNFLGPLIEAGAVERVGEYLALGRVEGRVAAQGEVPGEGYYVPPTVIVDLPASSRLLREEIFGPLLAVVRVRDMAEALAVANDSEYALTGGLFSRSPANIARAVREFAAGNLYVNRGITGAAVGRQPFGGFRLSGVGSKAGGPDYLPQLLEPRVVTENTMRRGFSPEVIS
jgi:RHH-type transcriptional regulator, proline utilization regulon repressor / proline dehydrogenase / delta 1-pyrroline-5-carboxylate dehydrogenase